VLAGGESEGAVLQSKEGNRAKAHRATDQAGKAFLEKIAATKPIDACRETDSKQIKSNAGLPK
jgi:hypothetical protein